MDRILLGAEILPWKDPISGEINEASRILPLALPAVPRHLLIEELVEIIVRKFERLHPDKGKLEIKCLFNGYKQMLDMADSVGDIFVDRTPGGVDERGFTVLVQRELPTPEELSGTVRFASVPPNSFARPPKRPSHGLLQRATAGRHVQEIACGRTELVNKRRRLNNGAREGVLDPDSVVRSIERDLDLPTIDEGGAECPRREASTYIIEDSQSSPVRSQHNMAKSPVNGAHEDAHATGGDTPKSEYPETDNIINDVPQSNLSTPPTPAPLQSETQRKTSTRPPLSFPKTETLGHYKQNGVLGATRLTTLRATTPGGQIVASNTGSRQRKFSYGRVSSDRCLDSKAFITGRRKSDIYDIESITESSQNVSLRRTRNRSKQNQSPVAQSFPRPKPYSHLNGSSASRPKSGHLSSNVSDGSKSGQAFSHEIGLNPPEPESPDLASITAPIFAKRTTQRVVDHAGKGIGRELPQIPKPHNPSVEKLNGESNPSKHKEDPADMEIDKQTQAEKPGKAKPSEHNGRLKDEQDPCRGTSSTSASRAVLQQNHAQQLHKEPSDATDMNMVSENDEGTPSDAAPNDSRASTSIPPDYRTKVAKKTTPAESSESDDSETDDGDSDELSDQEQVSDSKSKKGPRKTVSNEAIKPQSKTAEKKALPGKREPVTVASKAPTNKLSVDKPRTSITSPIPGRGPANINRSDSLSSRSTPSRNVSSKAVKGPSTTSRPSPILLRPLHRSVSFEDEVRNGSGKPRPPSVLVAEEESKPTVKELAAKNRQMEREAEKRRRQEFYDELRASFKSIPAQTIQKKPEAKKDEVVEAALVPLVQPPTAIVAERSKDKGIATIATITEKATASATNVAQSSRSPPESEPASVDAIVVPSSPESPTTNQYPEHVEVPRGDSVLGEENKDISYAFKRPESKSKSRSPARAVSSSVSSNSASDPDSDPDTESRSRGLSADSKGKNEPSLPVKHNTLGESLVSAIGGTSDTESSDSDRENDDGNLSAATPVSLSKSISTSPAVSRERANSASESASARDSAERQVQREIRESMEPSRSSQMHPPPKTSKAFPPCVKSGPATMREQGAFSVNARHPTLTSQMNNPKYKNPMIITSRQLKPAAKVNDSKYIETEGADDTDSTESDDEDDEETGDDEDVDFKTADPRSSQSSTGRAATGLRRLLKMSGAVIGPR